ncbi:MAG: heme biosynthesis protein HemY [Alphaproteobacteria bacterium]|nr:heme biosynthesis protein HemY [Alphaproteobacteria bacterium]MBV9551725.1 heme biosynthesis protein HemY [Alphaproteobacteria bacterium]
MRRLLALLVLAVMAIVAATIASQPGTVALAWGNWEIGTSVGVLAAVLAVAAVALWLLFLLAAGLFRLPRRFRRNRRERRRRAGELALTRGMAALAAGDAGAAQRYAARAELLLEGAPLALMLAAQAAELGGDEGAARQRFLALSGEKEAAFFGLRGLIGQALKDGAEDEALRLAARARALRPNTRWAFETLFALQTRAGRWQEASETLADAARRQLLPAARAEHHRGIIAQELSRIAETEGDLRRAVNLAASADNAVRDLPGPAVRHARLLIAGGHRRAARRVVEQAWRRAPHPELAQVWAELGDTGGALHVVTWFERLAALNPESGASAVAVAEAALAAQLWGEARRHLGRAIAATTGAPARRLCLLMARLEESEHADNAAARAWLDRAVDASADPAYICARCGAVNDRWTALCGCCRSFDALAWRNPSRQPPPVAAVPDLPAIPQAAVGASAAALEAGRA